jgi:FMN phosphatase YigB (HAD superfamily)
MGTERFVSDLGDRLEREFGAACRERYFAIEGALFTILGYRDYIGALQRYRVEHPYEDHLISLSSYLVDYPFADRLFPGAIDVLKRLRAWGQTVVLTDGDAVFQPRKLERSGVFAAVDGHVLIYIHKEEALADIERRYPATHYVLVDDKLHILTAIKNAWGDRVTTVFPRQGKFAHDPETLAEYPAADIAIDRIEELMNFDLGDLVATTVARAIQDRAPRVW